jgi:hypothetical protein
LNRRWKWVYVAPFTVYVLTLALACASLSAWPLIIATAQAITSLVTVFDPGVNQLSTDAVNLLQTAEAAANAYQANKNASTEAAYVAAIQAIEVKLPADLAALKVSAADQAKITAAVQIILDYVEALGVQSPPTAGVVINAHVRRGGPPIPKPLTRRQIKARWAALCAGDAKCAALVK